MAANQATAKKGLFARIRDYFKGVVSELKKVSWPTKKDIYRYTVVVIAICAAFAVLFWLIDTGILGLLGLLMG
ncbi:MAG: preprotein translocase subunit SecE [Firmicutes bacterium]|jgi:preprotein translocase subunit SecE|nr:preprotein translocase subunit SecE [Bacillota bacterium]